MIITYLPRDVSMHRWFLGKLSFPTHDSAKRSFAMQANNEPHTKKKTNNMDRPILYPLRQSVFVHTGYSHFPARK